MKYIEGPDFPLGGIILGTRGIKDAYEKGKGKIIVRSKVLIEEVNNRNCIIVTEIPYQVNKARLIEHIAELIRDKKIIGIHDLRDESDREGIRVDNEPKILNLKDILIHYLNYQKEVVTRRSKFDLKKAENNKHILEGYKIALDNIDEIIKIIRESNNNEIAKQSLIDRFELTEIQALSILEMRLRRLTALERDKIESELLEKMNLIKELKEILDNERSLLNLIKDELLEIKSIHNTDRRTYIDKTYYEDDINKDNLIHREDIVVTLTHDGYIKRMASNTYSSQKRGGRGMQAMTVKENDFIENIFHTTTHHNLLFFTNLGRVYNIDGLDNCGYILMATKLGLIKKTKISEFSKIRKNGLIAIGIKDNDELLNVKQTKGDANIVMVTTGGYAIIFNEKNIRSMGRSAAGVKAITLRKGDSLVAIDLATDGEDLLITSENGYGKRTPLKSYPIQNRGGKGIKTYKITEKTGKVSCACVVNENNDVMLINSNGVGIRIKTSDISKIGRSSLGVKLMKTNNNEKITTIGKIKE